MTLGAMACIHSIPCTTLIINSATYILLLNLRMKLPKLNTVITLNLHLVRILLTHSKLNFILLINKHHILRFSLF